MDFLLSGITVDFAKLPNEKERALLRKRLSRLNAMAQSVEKATANMKTLAGRSQPDAVQVRYEFVRTNTPPSGDPSDRRLPARADRPPATRLISPRGAALRFFLTALFEAQTDPANRPGRRPVNKRPLQAAGNAISWIDLLASDARAAGAGMNHISVPDKKARQVRNTLARLAAEELVTLTRREQAGNKYEEFRLLHEGGRREQGDNVAYRVPLHELTFAVSVEMFTSGWIHVLEDTELAFILMLAASHYDSGGQQVRIRAETRLLKYGIGRDAYEAHRMLGRLGLVTVTADPGRHPDGKIEGYNSGEPQTLLHTLGFLPDQFGRDALTDVRAQIEYQLSR